MKRTILSRRNTLFLLIAGISGTLLAPFKRTSFALSEIDADVIENALKVIADRVIPQTAKGGGAVAGNVHRALLKEIEEDNSLLKEVEVLAKKLNKICQKRFNGKTFEQIDSVSQTSLLRQVVDGDVRSGRIFQKIRNSVVDNYYGNPKTFGSIGFSGPSQYRGHPDYDKWPQT